MNRLTAFVLIFCLGASSAFAASCYSPAEYRAEQAVRYHTRLMIIGMRCQRILTPTAYVDYQNFTKRNQSVIRTQENLLISYFKEARSTPNAEKALHTLRTDLANNMSMQANGPGVMQFCRNYAGTLQQAKAMKPHDFQKWIASLNTQNAGASTVPLCAAAQRKR